MYLTRKHKDHIFTVCLNKKDQYSSIECWHPMLLLVFLEFSPDILMSDDDRRGLDEIASKTNISSYRSIRINREDVSLFRT